MITAVFDSNVIVSGLIWQGESYLCLVAYARRRVRVFASAWILEEVRRSVRELESEKSIPRNPWPGFNWFSNAARIVVPEPTGKSRSRDPNDDPILGTALAARARMIITKDHDLLELAKPFGIEILRPQDLFRELSR